MASASPATKRLRRTALKPLWVALSALVELHMQELCRSCAASHLAMTKTCSIGVSKKQVSPVQLSIQCNVAVTVSESSTCQHNKKSLQVLKQHCSCCGQGLSLVFCFFDQVSIVSVNRPQCELPGDSTSFCSALCSGHSLTGFVTTHTAVEPHDPTWQQWHAVLLVVQVAHCQICQSVCTCAKMPNSLHSSSMTCTKCNNHLQLRRQQLPS